MAQTFLTIARGIFDQKLLELAKFRDEVKSARGKKNLPEAPQKFREYERLVAELGKNYRKAEKLLAEIKVQMGRGKSKTKTKRAE